MHAPASEFATPASTFTLFRALAALLLELRDVLSGLSSEQYAQKPVGPVTSSIGGHTRHSLDHIEAIFSCTDLDDLDYDHRARGTPVESSRDAAIAKIDELLRKLDTPGCADSRPILLKAMVSAGGEAVTVQTTTDRELLFTFSHTLHHHALIRVMIELLGVQVPPRFGYAPATLAHLDVQPCAR